MTIGPIRMETLWRDHEERAAVLLRGRPRRRVRKALEEERRFLERLEVALPRMRAFGRHLDDLRRADAERRAAEATSAQVGPE